MSEKWPRILVVYKPCGHCAPWGTDKPDGPVNMWWLAGTVPPCPQCDKPVSGVVTVGLESDERDGSE